MYLSLTHLDAENICGPENKSDQRMDVISGAQWKKKKFKHNTVLVRAIWCCIKSSVLVAFGHHVPYALFCEWLQQWLGTQTLSATMHNHVCEGFYVVVCDREGASDIAAPGLKDYPHMRPAIFPLSVDLFTSSKHNMVARVVSLPGLPELFHHCLSTIASQLGLFVGHTGAVDQPSSPRIPEDTYLDHLFYNKTSTMPTPALPPPVKLLIFAPRSQQIPCHVSLQARGKIHKQTLVQETVKFPDSCAFPPPNQKSL
jgi:hypothetical protein